jgi:hypothetical protein
MTEQEKRNLVRLLKASHEIQMHALNPLGPSLAWLALATAVICPISLMWLIYMLYFGGR